MAIRDRPTTPHSPWQNGYAERLIGSIRRECLDHVVVLNADHLRRVLQAYAEYYNNDRTHLALGKDAPHFCDVLIRSSSRRGGVEALGLISRLESAGQRLRFHARPNRTVPSFRDPFSTDCITATDESDPDGVFGTDTRLARPCTSLILHRHQVG